VEVPFRFGLAHNARLFQQIDNRVCSCDLSSVIELQLDEFTLIALQIRTIIIVLGGKSYKTTGVVVPGGLGVTERF